ncbi:MAG: hydrolase [Tatlockia sp.]|jgi:glutamate carboxypeptidase
MVNKTRELLLGLHEKNQLMVEQLHAFCSINSGTENLPGLAKMRQTLEAAFLPLADSIETIPFPETTALNIEGFAQRQSYGDGLWIRKRPELKRRVLLCGHMDTVYGANHPFHAVTMLSDNKLNGPGVADMKGGLIVLLHALICFEASSLSPLLGWDVFINTDEEVGSPASRFFYEQIAGDYQAALVYEPAMNEQGTLAKNRKGSGKFTLIAEGKSAHAGRAFFEGKNAICHLAEAITAIHALNDLDNGITLNVGKIAGGDALNRVPDKAVAQIDVRISKPEDALWVTEQFNRIREEGKREGCTLAIEGYFGRPVKTVSNGTARLFQRVKQVGEVLGLAIDWQDSGGCCDGNNLAALGLPVIDTLGVRGGNIHTEAEYILLDSLVERSALSALLLMDLAGSGLEDLNQ